MRIFVSYARVDKPFCIQIVDTLDVHETWYDQRLYAGQNWWKEILRRLDWCESFVYLLSPDSIASEYCNKEFELAQSLGKHIVPVLIRSDVVLPDNLKDMQYVDLTNGITIEAVKILLNSIYIAERKKNPPTLPITSDQVAPPTANPANVISVAATAMENGQFDQAVFHLKQAKENGFTSRFINLDALLQEAETALERLSYLREAEREYKQIADLVKLSRTRKLGLEAFEAFRRDYPDYDPDEMAQLISKPDTSKKAILPITSPKEAKLISFTLPLLEWCDIPQGALTNGDSDKQNKTPQIIVPKFRMSKYPVTHSQFSVFCSDSDGYSNTKWWEYSPEAYNWRINNPEPKPGRFRGDERPREMVNWYDAVAFCRWLSIKTQTFISLPTANEWQRAARGDDNRIYPWGNVFDKNRCNTRESEIKMTSLVMRYANGVSPYNVYDMAGNVWEWCLNAKPKQDINDQLMNADDQIDLTLAGERAVFGGSFVSAYQRSQISFHYYLDPLCYHATIGFRIIQKVGE
ncbi:MAG: SUMF1/EgtB/PvdO family nonheme iron enzyme [Chloroflexi bacterium]|nr:SUMF1/EgtB/PvdO family nonheme iron enzyme [Chloroflexota bacterium]MCC6891304.1 SUMF1/EgtB/PvdO family nonheme iron enzyme [Anaerolineae bacterium]